MIRKTLLMILTFAVLLGLFIVCREAFTVAPGPRGGGPKPSDNIPVLPDANGQVASQPTTSPFAGGRDIGAGVELNYVHYNDRTRQMAWAFHADRYDREPDGSLLMQKPSVQFFQKSGRIYLLGDRGRVYSEQVQGKVKPNSGHFEGNVLVLIDRNPQGTYATIGQRPGDVVRVTMNEVDFDNSQLKISTPGQVDLQSREMDIRASGLTMRLEEAPSELRSLRFERGEVMTIKTQMQGFGQMPLSTTSQPATAASHGSTAKPVPLAPLPAESQLSQKPPSVDDSDLPGFAKIDEILRNGPDLATLASRPTTMPATRPASRSGKVDKNQDYGPKKNVYFAEFEDADSNMTIESPKGERELHKISRLAMIVNWDSADKNPLAGPTTSTTKPARPKRGEPTSMPATAKAPKETPLAEQPTVIRWTGPLTLVPLAYTADAGNRDYKVYARGDGMNMIEYEPLDKTATRPAPAADAPRKIRSTVTLREMFYYRIFDKSKVVVNRGRLIGAEDRKVHLEIAGGNLIESPVVKLDGIAGRVDLLGEHRMEMPHNAAMSLTGTTRPATQPEELASTTQPAAPDVIKCDKWTMAFLDQRPSDNGKPQMFIRQAQCIGKTNVTSPSSGQTIDCSERTYIEMDPKSDWKVTKFLSARGDVKITMQQSADATGAKREPIVITGDRVFGLPLEGRYEMFGTAQKFASASQVAKGGTNGVQGPHIIMSMEDVKNSPEKQRVVRVVGGGQLDAMSDRGPNNEVLAKSLPVKVTWTKWMNFFGADQKAAFSGDVVMNRAGLDNISGQQMDVYFAAAEPTTQPATAPVAAATTKPAKPKAAKPKHAAIAMDMDSMTNLRVARVEVKDNVRVLSKRLDDDGHMTYRIQLTCNNLDYDAVKKLMTVLGAGNLLTEDYNKPKDAPSPQAGEAGSANPLASKETITSPSRTLFDWSKLMILSQAPDKSSTVEMNGNVLMVHVSGAKLELSEDDKKQLNVPKWGPLPVGRHSKLACDTMRAEFDKPDVKSAAGGKESAAASGATSKPAGDTSQLGMQVGKIRNFKAFGDVSLEDGVYKMLGRRLLLDGETNMMTIYGYLDGERKMLAQLIQTDPVKGPRVQEGEVIKWNTKTDEITIQGGRAVGGR